MIGTFLGISSRTVERHLHALKEDGLISTSKGKIYISPAQYQELLNLVTSNL
ncbi:winged helix-turn-helix domain-containing protein [Mediterraneibacter glycyrrhizinilyticus]|uniref:helix-turn-helix domain-containing protein n=1 Tax=Mediterraneibacter glycyrrhizinilyticus TaxID=342942 RepID=UPI0030401403|nr:winged helix-turn-helix domain-containing protein [Mediterraneibacter glycyrrhizinilyticus]